MKRIEKISRARGCKILWTLLTILLFSVSLYSQESKLPFSEDFTIECDSDTNNFPIGNLNEWEGNRGWERWNGPIDGSISRFRTDNHQWTASFDAWGLKMPFANITNPINDRAAHVVLSREHKRWLISPIIDISNEPKNIRLSFDIAMTENILDRMPRVQQDDVFAVLITKQSSISGSQQFQTLKRWDRSGDYYDISLLSHQGQRESIDITLSENDEIVRIAFYAGRGFANDRIIWFFIDNVDLQAVDDTTPLSITLSSFDAIVSSDKSVHVLWSTEFEFDVKGFHIFRNEHECLETASRITMNLVNGNNTSFTSNYAFFDEDVLLNKRYYYWLLLTMNDGTSVFHGPRSAEIKQIGEFKPLITSLESVYPNPLHANSQAFFRVSVKDGETATLKIFNLRGQVVREYPGITSGSRTIQWDRKDSFGREISSGIYFYILTSPSIKEVRRMLLIK